jgi:hypothetical protein
MVAAESSRPIRSCPAPLSHGAPGSPIVSVIVPVVVSVIVPLTLLVLFSTVFFPLVLGQVGSKTTDDSADCHVALAGSLVAA